VKPSEARPSGARPLHSGFLASARRYPERPALSVGERTWTYDEVERTARRWATAIVETLERPPRLVGVFGHRSEVGYIGGLAALFAGAGFVPLSPTLPPGRTRAMLEAAGVDAVIADDAAAPRLAEVLPGSPPILLPESDRPTVDPPDGILRDRRDLERAVPLSEPVPVSEDSVAYLLFTSGSTGIPKGVPITHANVAHFLEVNRRRYRFGPDDRLTQTFDLIFDLSIFDLFMAWGSGACVCSPRPIDLLSPFRFVAEQGITVWFSVPSVATLLRRKRLLEAGSLPTLRWSLFCGEALTRSMAEAWQAAAPNSTLENLYGPTETTIACTAYRWDPERSPGECVNGLVPIGALFEGLNALIVDEELEPVPSGEPGELCVAGPQTFSGYWRDPDATASSMFTRTGPDGADLRYYRTGDRIRNLETGDLAFLGRLDHQVQVMGNRVELAEVESVLLGQPGVIEAAAVALGLDAGRADGLAAFISGRDVDVGAILEAARARLPGYMVPRTLQVLGGLPLTPNGKVDRPALRRLVDRDDRLTGAG
jgi:amino acid adenylation domain-containing protein